MRFNSIVLLIISFLVIGIFLPGCGGSSGESGSGYFGGSGGDGGGSTTVKTDFVGYLYGPTPKAKEPTSTGLIILQSTPPPSGYQAVSGATIYLENSPTSTTTTDTSGMFTIPSSFLRGHKGETDITYLICVPPEIGPFSSYAPTRCQCYQMIQNADNIKKIILHPNARNLRVGEVIQLYAKAVLEDGGVRYVDPTKVTWQIDNGSIATVSSTGIAIGVSTGKTNVTITFGGKSCTGMLHVKSGDSFYTIRGTVKGASGNPVPSAVVMVSELDVAAVVKSDGTYIYPGIPGNTDLTIMVYLQGVLRYNATLRITGDTTYNITLPSTLPQKGSISGTVTEKEGGALEGVLVSTGDWSTTTDSSGSYALNDLPEGSYSFSFSKAGYVSVTRIQEINGGATAALDVALQKSATVTTGTLNGRVIDGLNTGIPGATVSYSARGKLKGRGSATTDSNGFFSFAEVLAGSCRVQADKQGYGSNYIDVEVKAGEEVNATITLLQTSPTPSPSPTATVSPTPTPPGGGGGGGGVSLVSIDITPTETTITTGSTFQFNAKGIYSNGSQVDITAQVSWSLSNAATGSFVGLGFFTAAHTGAFPQTALITATLNGVSSANAQITVRERSWDTAEIIETDTTGNDYDPHVAMDANGNAIVVWLQYDDTRRDLWASRYTPAGGWGTAELIETDNAGDVFRPRVAMDSNGNAVAVWHQSDGTRNNIWSNHYTPAGGWGTAELIETDNAGNASNPDVAMDPNGNAIAIWDQSDGTRSNSWANRYTQAGGWGTAELIETYDTGDAYAIKVAMDSNGNAITVGYQDDGTRYNSWANRYTPAGGWGTAELIETDNTGNASQQQVAMDASGNAVAVWHQDDGTRYNMWANHYTPTGGWGTAELIETENGGNADHPSVSMDADGNAIVVWHQYEAIRDSIWSNRYSPIGGWGAAQPIETDNSYDADNPKVAMDSNGNAIAVWVQASATKWNIWSNRYTPAGGWGTAELIETNNAGDAYMPWVAMNASGDAVAVWHQSDGTRNNIWANLYR